MLVITQALTENQIKQTKKLFREYANYLDIDLSFQNFKEEIDRLPGDYSPPEGCILLAYYNSKLVGCVALRKFQNNVCEMKRLYIRPNYRKKGIGKALSNAIINKAIEFGYDIMRLDTLPFMREAISLYLTLGFKEIPPYRYNPINNAKFYELKL